MKNWLKILVGALFIHISTAATVFSLDDKTYSEDEGLYVGQMRPATGTEDVLEQAGKANPLSGIPLQSGIPLVRPRIFPDKGDREVSPDKGDREGRGIGIDEKDAAKSGKAEKKAQITLRTEAGDGLVALSWAISDRNLTTRLPLKFTLFYGPESGRYDKKIDVGTATEYKLRELKNNQTYFIKVYGYGRHHSITIFSKEASVMPLPEEAAGSLLEKSFTEKTATLQDRFETDPLKRKLRQFGYDFFQNTLLTGVASENLPVGDEYILGPGDSLNIDIWGSINARSELQVDRNGEIAIPKVGTVKVWGLTYRQANETINKAISRYFKGYQLNVTLGRLRTIQVYMVGEVAAPGMYNVSSLATVVNALALAGGPSRTGSLRALKLLRKGKAAQEIDLYDMLLSGDRSKDIRLENGDTIFVPVIGPVAAVAGEVKRPAIYELKGKPTLKQLLEMAGGITAAGYIGRIQVERFEGNSARVVVDYEPKTGPIDEKLASVEIHDRDMVKVFPINKALRRVVTLKGNVVRPGEYQYKEGMRLLDLIPNYEVLQPETFAGSVQIIRLALPDFHREALSANLAKALAGDPGENILLQEQDVVTVYSRSDMMEKYLVTISGEVLHPGVNRFYDNMRVRDLIGDAGSLNMNAYLDDAELTRIVIEGGEARSTRKEIDLRKALAGDPEHNILLQPNDSIIVRGIPNWLKASDRFVTLKGEVKFPGTYSISKGEKLSSVLERAGGFTEKAYLLGAKFTRKSVQENQQKRMDEIIAKSEQDILKREAELTSLSASRDELEATKASLEGLMKSLEKLKTVKAEGRVVIHLTPLENFKRTPYDIELTGGDILDIPLTPNVVNVLGQVYNTATLIHMPGEKLSYYLQKSGGPNRDGEESEMYLIKADGTVVSREQSSLGMHWDETMKRWTFGGFMSLPVDPGDTLVVPQKLERTAWMRELKDITTIMSQIALTAGVVLVGLQ